MEQLIHKLQHEDKKLFRMYWGVSIVYLILTPVYALIYLLDPELIPIQRLGGMLVVAGFVTFVLLFRLRIKEFRAIDYSLPTILMLKKTIRRYSLWKTELWWALLGIAFMDCGLALSRFKSAELGANIDPILHAQYTILPAVTIGFLIGYVWWYLKHKPIRDNAQRLLDELLTE